MEKYIENKDGWTRSGSHNSPLRFRTFSMYIDLFIKPKSMKISFFNPSVEEKSIHVYAQSKKH